MWPRLAHCGSGQHEVNLPLLLDEPGGCLRRGVSLTNEGQSFLGQAVRLGPGRALTGSRNCLSRRSKSGQNDSSFPRLQLRPSWRVRNLCLFLFTPPLTESEASESGLLAYQKNFLPIQKPIWFFQKQVGQGRLTARGGACAVVHHYMRMFSLMPQEKGKKKSFLDCPGHSRPLAGVPTQSRFPQVASPQSFPGASLGLYHAACKRGGHTWDINITEMRPLSPLRAHGHTCRSPGRPRPRGARRIPT